MPLWARYMYVNTGAGRGQKSENLWTGVIGNCTG